MTGYGVFADGTRVGTSTVSRYTFSGFTCGTRHRLAVNAFDAAGNNSGRTAVTASTDKCPAPPPDTHPPSTPAHLHVTGSTGSSISIGWDASTDDVGVAGYDVYRGSTIVDRTRTTSYTVRNLDCGTRYSLAVDAYDRVGNRSSNAGLSASTSACPDTQRPSTPSGLHLTGSTTTSLSVAWNASTDNVRVASYGLYRNGTSTGGTSSTSATFTGLSCSTTYTLSVDAVDPAGNRSKLATMTSSTKACAAPTPPPPPPSPPPPPPSPPFPPPPPPPPFPSPPPPPPPPPSPPSPPPGDTQAPSTPGGLRVTSATDTAISIAWNASTDNVGVTGYGLYRGGSLTG
ncbi:MAG TPA: fibronectin type III domain-containing protein, partial [Gaiellaceae bacterium]